MPIGLQPPSPGRQSAGRNRFRTSNGQRYTSFAGDLPKGRNVMVIDGAERLMCGIELEVVRRRILRTMLLLHAFQTVAPHARFLELLGRYCDIVAPSSPGFAHSSRPKDFDTVYDLVHLYLELLETL